ncbi:hypothetical protein Hypma_014866 [Hypsizygus marmoreus]|uniref:Protein kinase domain-containing protein n=1 Tax=Hypsizygus marmoreus TaxID=39966 RepID=A0A369KA28_HYPMA|nr:hypothetical protein Hypma_014866 [Hypsizygus marmoreus]
MGELTEGEILLQIDTEYVEEPWRLPTLWNSEYMRNWFNERGYHLYVWMKNEYEQSTLVCHPSRPDECEDTAFPYAYRGGDDHLVWNLDYQPALLMMDSKGNMLYAQNLQGHHVAIKLVKTRREYEILQYLLELGIPQTRQDFNYVIPILEILPFGHYWFAVMPRWGDLPDHPAPETIGEVLDFIHCMLKGMDFLHRHRIAHGDITPGNTLVNHFGRGHFMRTNPLRRKLRSEGLLTYALFDFDYSTMFPRTATFDECRLPYQESWHGTPGFTPLDTTQGEFDFDPFAWDVCGMSMTLCYEFQHLVPDVPILAPLLDKMVMRDPARRFTASEALRFFEEVVYPWASQRKLLQCYACAAGDESDKSADRDRWKELDPAFNLCLGSPPFLELRPYSAFLHVGLSNAEISQITNAAPTETKLPPPAPDRIPIRCLEHENTSLTYL